MSEKPGLAHGGRLREAAARYGIPLENWLDLSTGINPFPWPVPALPADCWQRLPEENDGLEAAAAAYYGNTHLLPVAGSQAAIQFLPHLLPRGMVACLSPLYGEHPHAWQRAGHRLRHLQNAPLKRALTAATPYVLLCNPNNPTADRHDYAVAVDAAQQLKKRGGWLIIDEAFIDAEPENSLTALAGTAEAPNLIVFRSLGKFFGLAGLRVGFLFAAPDLLAKMADLMGPWTLAGPSRSAARLALEDRHWQNTMRPQLFAASQRLQALLTPLGEVKTTALFATLTHPGSEALHTYLAQRAILTRHFDGLPLLRFGLPATEADWVRLQKALNEWSPS